jgi:hypothetical protein
MLPFFAPFIPDQVPIENKKALPNNDKAFS